jgi:hypothetical protein
MFMTCPTVRADRIGPAPGGRSLVAISKAAIINTRVHDPPGRE